MKRLTRKVLHTRVQELEARLEAAGGETRKNLRERITRTTKELAETKKELETVQANNKANVNLLAQCCLVIGKINETNQGDIPVALKAIHEQIRQFAPTVDISPPE